MLEIVNYNEGEYEFPCLLVLGCFDGLHIGHAELLKKAKLQAKINGLDLGVMMFADGKGGKQVYSFEEKVALLEQYNVKFVLKIEFTNEFKNTKPLDFLQVLEDKLNVKAYMSGKDFRFGAGAKGKSSTLKNYCEDEENGVWYMPVKDVLSGADKVSTTLVKTLLENGDISRANELLGREYSLHVTVTEICGNVVKVAYPENIIKVKDGSYCVKCVVGENEYCGTATVGENIQIELDGLGENLDGQNIEIKFSACEGLSEAVCPSEEQSAAVEEFAVADESENVAETENTEIAEPAAEPTEENVPETETATVPAAEETSEESEFENELNEEYEEPIAQNEEPAEAVDVAESMPEEITEELPVEENSTDENNGEPEEVVEETGGDEN